MAYVVNLYGPNTHGLAVMASGILQQMGYSCLTVPSERRRHELDSLRAGIDGKTGLDECVGMYEDQAKRRDAATRTGADVVFDCGAGPDSFIDADCDRSDPLFKQAVCRAVEASRGDLEILPTQGLRKSQIGEWREFLRESNVAPKIKAGCEFGCEDIVKLVSSSLEKQNDVQRVTRSRDSLVTGFKAPPTSVSQAAQEKSTGGFLGRTLRDAAAKALKDGFGGIHLESVRGGKAVRLDEQLEAAVHPSAPDASPQKVNMADNGKAKNTKGTTMSKSQYVNIEFRDENLRLGEYKSGKLEGLPRINCTMPQGTVVDGRDVSGFKASRPAPQWLVDAKTNHQESIKVGFPADRDMQLFKYDKSGGRETLQLPAELVQAAVATAYENAPAKEGANAAERAQQKYVNIEFRDDELRLGEYKSGKLEGKPKINCTMPQGTVVDGRDISGFKATRPAPQWLVDAKTNHQESIKVGFPADRDMQLYRFDKDGNRETLEVAAKDVADAVGEAYKEADAIGEPESLDDLASAKEAEAQGRDTEADKSAGQPDLYDHDVEF